MARTPQSFKFFGDDGGGGTSVAPQPTKGSRFDPYLWSDYGGLSSKTQDQTSTFDAFISNAKSENAPIYLGQDTDIVITPSSPIDLTGIPLIQGDDVRLDISGAHEYGTGAVFTVSGSKTELATNVSADAGDRVIDLGSSNLDLSRGDTIILASTEQLPTDRAYYRKGERLKVTDYPVDKYGDRDSNDTFVRVGRGIEFSYDGGTSNNAVHKLSHQQFHVPEGITFKGDPTKEIRGFDLDTVRGSMECRFESVSERCVEAKFSQFQFGGTIKSPGADGPNTFGTKYGVVGSNLTDLSVTGAQIWAGRHAVAGGTAGSDLGLANGNSSTSAGYPVHNYTVTGGTYASLPPSAPDEDGAIDAHGNVVDFSLTGAKVYGGVNCRSKRATTEGNTIVYFFNRGYYVSSDLNDTSREWGTHKVLDNHFIAVGRTTSDGDSVPPGEFYEIQSADTGANTITVAGDVAMSINDQTTFKVYDDADRSELDTLSVDSNANDPVDYDSSTDKTTVTVKSLTTDYSGDLMGVPNPVGSFVETHPDDGMRQMIVKGNTLDGDFADSRREPTKLLKPTALPTIYEDNEIQADNTNAEHRIEPYSDVIARGNKLDGNELLIEAQVAGLDVDLSGTWSRGSWRRGVRVDTSSAGSNRYNRVYGSGLDIRTASERGLSIVDASVVQFSSSTIAENGTDGSFSSRDNLDCVDVDEINVFTVDLSSDNANTEAGLKVSHVNLSSTELRVGSVDVRTGGTEIDFASANTINWETRWDVVSNSPETWTDLVSRLDIEDVSTDPDENGEIRRNGTDVKAYTGGQVRNLSNIGTVENLEDDGSVVVSPARTIDFGGGYFEVSDLGGEEAQITISNDAIGASEIDSTAEVTVEELAVSDPADAIVDLTADTDANAGGTQRWTLRVVDSDGDFVIREETGGGGAYFVMDTNANLGLGGYPTPSYAIEMDGSLRLRDDSGDPSVNGQFRVNGNDVKVYTGGGVKNLSDIGTGGGTNVDVQEGGTTVVDPVETLDFASGDFSVTNPTTGEAAVALQDDTVTVAGNAVALGNSTAVDHSDLSNIGASDHHAKYTDEEAQDAVATALTGGTDIDVTYDDPGNTLTVSFNGLTVEEGQTQVTDDALTLNFASQDFNVSVSGNTVDISLV